MRSPSSLTPVLLCALLAPLAGCERKTQAPPASPPPASDTAASAASSAPPAPAPEPPAESSLALKRGIVMLAQDRVTFRPCGDKAELWMLDQTDGVLKQAFASQGTGPTMLYAEVYGERAPVVTEVPAASAYGGSFVLEEVLYAAVQSQTRGCDAPAPNYVIAARGNEPGWAVEVFESEMRWRQAGEAKELVLQAPQTRDTEGADPYHGRGQRHAP